MRSVSFTPAATRQWIKLPPDVRSRIDRRLTEFADRGTGDVKRLKGRDGACLRVGDWRVIFFDGGDTIVVTTVGHRRDIYQ